MRAPAWIFLICTVLTVIGVFLPSVEVPVTSTTIGKRTSLSLYQANTNRELVRKLVMNYHRSSSRPIGAALIGVMSPRIGGKLKSYLGDARDAMDTLDGVTDDDAKTLGKVLAITVWTFLLLHAVMAALVFGEAMRVKDGFRTGRIIAALAVSVVVTAVAIAIHLVCKEAVFEANDEVGREALGLAVGAYMIPIASIAGSLAIIALLVQRLRWKPPLDVPVPAIG